MSKCRFALVILINSCCLLLVNNSHAGAANSGKNSDSAGKKDSASRASDEGPILSAAQVEKLVGQKKISYEGHYEAGRFFESKGLYDQATEHLKLAVADKNAQVNAFRHLAQIQLTTQKPAEAEATIREGVKRFPKDFGVHLTAGFVFHNERKLTDALAMYKIATSIRPDFPDIYLPTADVLIDMKKPQEALDLIKHSLALGRPTSLTYFEQAKALMALGKIDDALASLKKNYLSEPVNFKSGQFYSALLFKQGKKAEALEVNCCLLTVTSGPSMEDTKTMVLGLIAGLTPDVVKATIKKAEDRIPDKKAKAVIHFALGDVYDRAKHTDEAIAQYQAGLQLNPSFARGNLRLAEDLEATKADKKAMEYYDRAFKSDPHDGEILSRRAQMIRKLQNPGSH